MIEQRHAAVAHDESVCAFSSLTSKLAVSHMHVAMKARMMQQESKVPEGLSVKVHAAIAFICQSVVQDGLDVLNNFSHVLADPGHHVWSAAAQGIHIFIEFTLISGSVLPAAYFAEIPMICLVASRQQSQYAACTRVCRNYAVLQSSLS